MEKDGIVRVDRSILPTYPDWTAEILYPELSRTGPVEYNLSDIKLWLHQRQHSGAVRRIKGITLHNDLVKKDRLKDCLSLRDGEEIQKKRILSFWNSFGHKNLLLWKSAVKDKYAGEDGLISVPYAHLLEKRGEVGIDWLWLDRVLQPNDFTPHFGEW